MPQGGAYTMAKLGGKDVAGIGPMMADQQKSGMPSHWNLYFAVNNADEMVKKATGLGAKVVAPAFDVMEAGRMAVLQDPSGAYFSLWQAGKHWGAAKMMETGAACWAELATRNVDACGSFYGKLFDWKAKASEMAGMSYTTFNMGGPEMAGMMPMPKEAPAQVPSHWTVYFAVASCDATVTKAKSLGAKVMVEAQDIPTVGRFAMLFDPQGAFFAILQPNPRS